MKRDYDVVIIGAGMVGSSLACLLAPFGLRIAVVESMQLSNIQRSGYDDRGITLSPSSKRILDYIGVWQQMRHDIFPIKNIHISEQGRFGFVRISASEVGCSELAYIVIACALRQALHKKMNSFSNIHLLCPAELKHFQQLDNDMRINIINVGKNQMITAGLLVGADGNQSLVRHLSGISTTQFHFKQTAIVVSVKTQISNVATAFERFTPHGPVALLPIGDKQSVLVFTVDINDADRYLSMSEKLFTDEVEKEFGRRLGRIEQIGQRRSYPLIFSRAFQQYQDQLVLLGNAAYAMHPNAAQGFNLSLRDAAGLVESICAGIRKGYDISDVHLLKEYMELRKNDQKRIMWFSNGLAMIFYNKWPILSSVRNLTMLMVDIIPEIKSSFVETSMGIAGLQPRIVRGLSL